MKKFFFTLTLLIFSFAGANFAQTNENSTQQPIVIKAVAPTYIPATALALKAEGKVEVAVKINRKGEVESTKSVSGHSLLQKLSENIGSQWLFNKDEKDRFITLTFVFHRVYSSKEETTVFLPPFQVELFYRAPEIIVTPSGIETKINYVKQPEVIKYFAPKYPQAAKAVKATGETIVAVKIDKAGKVISASAESGHPLLRQAAENAAAKWLFSVDNKTDERTVKITFVFDIDFGKSRKDKIKFKKPYRLEYILREAPIVDF